MSYVSCMSYVINMSLKMSYVIYISIFMNHAKPNSFFTIYKDKFETSKI